MRFSVELELENNKISKDKNRIILSYLKHIYESYDSEYYKCLYESKDNKTKNFTFSIYMRDCIFSREYIEIPDKKIILNFSTSDMESGIIFYNAVLSNMGKQYLIKENKIKTNNINIVKEKLIMRNKVTFKSMSPIMIREHMGDNKKTWYHSFDDEKGRKIFLDNLKLQLLDEFGQEGLRDIEGVSYEIIQNKNVRIKDYNITTLANICILNIEAKPYILEYIYKSGIGSRKSSGYGMLDIL